MALTTKPDIKVSQIDTVRPVTKTMVITESDTNYLADSDDKPLVTRGLIVSTDGTIKVEFADDAEDDLRTITVKAGVVYPFAVVLVHTDTSAGTITGLF